MTFTEEAIRGCQPDCRWFTLGVIIAGSGPISGELFNPPFWVTVGLITIGLCLMAVQWYKNTRQPTCCDLCECSYVDGVLEVCEQHKAPEERK